MYPHKSRPPSIRRVEVRQLRAVGVGPPRADEYGLEPGSLLQVGVERGAHGQAVAAQVEVVLGDGVLDELVDLGEGVLGHDVDGLEGVRERGGGLRARGGVVRGVGRRLRRRPVQVEGGGQRGVRRRGGGRGGGGGGGLGIEVSGQTGEDEDEQDEAVLAAVVGEREFFEAA